MEAAAPAECKKKLSVVLFPWLAFGHMIPYLELAKRLAARGHAATLLSTPRNVARLPPVPAHLSPLIRLVALPAPRVEGLPEGAESTTDVPPEQNGLIKKALDGLAAPFAAFLADAVAAGERPDWIVNDFAHHWLPAIASGHGVPCATFLIVQSTTIAFMGPRWAHAAHPRTTHEDFTVPPKWWPPPPPSGSGSGIAYRRHEADWALGALQPSESGVSDMERMWDIIERTCFTIYRSCEELEPGAFKLLTDLFHKPVIPAGVLMEPEPDHRDDDPRTGGARPEVLQWLDKQPPNSVVYVALGSEAPLTSATLHELALGLELAGVRFLWGFRKPAGVSAAGGAGELLPPGFTERTRGHGLLWSGWVPQVAALAHGAVAAFLTHCGWGSTIESLVFGRPLVMLPFVVDQGLIARAMAERGVGVEVARDDGDGSFTRADVAAAVRRVTVDEEGKAMASNARRMKEALGDRRQQDRYMDELVGYLARYKEDTNCS